jgi:NADH-quinone oxidoreductase subunit E
MSYFAQHPDRVKEILSRYPDDRKRSAVMPLLREVQNAFGFVNDEQIAEIAEIIESTATEVKSVMSFYSTYSSVPTGKYHLQVCMTLSCALAGSDQLWDYLQDKLEITMGEVTPDGLFSLQRVECLGSCGTSPLMQLNDAGYAENLTRKRTDALLEELRRRGDGSVPANDVRPPVHMHITNGIVGQETADGRPNLSTGISTGGTQ